MYQILKINYNLIKNYKLLKACDVWSRQVGAQKLEYILVIWIKVVHEMLPLAFHYLGFDGIKRLS